MTPGDGGPTWITDQLAVGPAPMAHHLLDQLRRDGVSAILNVCPELPELADIERDHGFEVFQLPATDEEAPEMQHLEKALAWLDEALYLGKNAYIHCRHGLGRTGTVLNAYLLRRGFGHRGAARMLRKLRSKPANFDQWWSIRKYGRRNPRLTACKPCLELKRSVDLAPFLMDFEALLDSAEQQAQQAAPGRRCGVDHDRCCSRELCLGLVEAVHLAAAVDALPSRKRRAAIQRAARRTKGDAPQACPLLEDGRCLLGQDRPLECRLFDLPPESAQALRHDLGPALKEVSDQVYLAFTSAFAQGPALSFNLADVVSGRYVQKFFHHLREADLL
ncbi:MAG: protein-tyrosine phosphatase family protein [Desulfovibrionaceae bacterium]